MMLPSPLQLPRWQQIVPKKSSFDPDQGVALDWHYHAMFNRRLRKGEKS
jgi:hypothetical protein